MALTYKQRRRWALLLLLVFLPIYILIAMTIMAVAGRAPMLIEFAIYVILGVAWIFPFKRIFMGIGQADPDAVDPQD